jgi:branched-chain amino acid transport system substrate-binding protein
MKRIVALAVAALALVAISACGSSSSDDTSSSPSASTSSSASKSPYVIGSLVTQTGTFSDSDAPGALGIKAWADAINSKGGIDGHPVKLTVKDDKSNPSVALAAVKQFVADKNVIALVGNVSSVEQTWAPIAAKAGLPVIGDFPFTPVSFSTKLVFPQATTFPSVLYGQVYSAVKLANAKKVAFFYCAEEPACALSAPVVKKEAANLGGASVNAQGVPATAPNYDAQCTAAKNAGADALILALGSGTIISLAQSCSSIGYHPKYVFQTTSVNPQMGTVKALDGASYGVVGTFPWTASETPAQQAFQEAVKAAAIPADKMGPAVSLAWTGGALFEAGAKAAGGEVTRESIATGLWSLPAATTLDGLAPPLTYKKDAPSPEVKCVFVTQLTGGKWTPVGGPTKTYCQP